MNSSYLAPLNPAQRRAACHTDGPLLVLAGAGSGKTRMLTARITHLISEKGVAPWQILAVTFTNKAAGEMRHRVDRALAEVGHRSDLAGSPEIGTFHSVCVRILRREGQSLPFTRPFVIYDDSDQLQLLKTVLSKLQIDEKAFSAKSFQYAINRAKCDGQGPDEIEISVFSPFEKRLKEVYREYQKDLLGSNALDFGEILFLTYRLFRDHPEVLKKYQDRYRYIHVDEYQDTNRIQYLLLALLSQRVHGGSENLCVVGDEDQSIYKWRGADIRNILDFENDFANPVTIKLEQNYRSTSNIIRAAGHVIQNNSQRKEKTLWTENSDGDLIDWWQCQDERQEAEQVIREIQRLAREDGRSYDEFAIFYRTHSQSRQFEDLFRREKIPYQMVGGLRFYDRKEIKDILSYFRVLLNPEDSVSWKRILNVPARGIGKGSIEKLEALGVPFGTALTLSLKDPALVGRSHKKIVEFMEFMARLQERRMSLSVSELYHVILDETRYVEELKREATDESLARIENLEEFDNLILDFEEEQGETPIEVQLERFLEQTALASDVDSAGEVTGTVKMMTLHGSKGLEFPVVFLVGLEEGLFPSIRQGEKEDPDDIEEERRLCYVGMTRAEERLTLSSVQNRRIWGNFLYQYPARFIQEIPDEFLVKKNFTTQNNYSQRRDHNFDQKYEREETSSLSSSKFGANLADEWIGKRLIHPEYGRGVVLKTEGSGETKKAMIEFEGRLQKRFLVRFLHALIDHE